MIAWFVGHAVTVLLAAALFTLFGLAALAGRVIQ